MKKILILILFTVIFADFIIEPYLVETLTEDAIENIKNLPEKEQEIYKLYLKVHPDGLMAYLISTEKSAMLWDANPKDLLDNYKYLKKLLSMEDYEQYSDEFVLSYIAKTTISHEQITNYRKVFAQEGLLSFVVKYPDLMDRFRMVTLWTRENMTFVSTSGRNQDPITILKKSNIGRCGEMQVFYIAALRTVGIPARPAWTPWWAHTDNNHAWTEIYIDEKWQYAENTSPEYHLNSTWFSASSQKTLLILARSSFPDESDDVVSKGKNNNYVNSTRYYQDTRQITINLFDQNYQPVKNAKVNIMAYNFSMMRSLLELEVDSTGMVEFTIGQGGFMAVAFTDSLFDYIVVPFDSTSSPLMYDLLLQEKKWENIDIEMPYPKGFADRPENPPFFSEWKQNSESKYDSLTASFNNIKFDAHAPWGDTTFVEVYQKCRNNQRILLKFAEVQSPPHDFWEALLQIDKKFLWEMTVKQLSYLYDNFQYLKQNLENEDDLINLLSPSVFYETLPNRKVPNNLIIPKKSKEEKLSYVIENLHTQYKIDKDLAVNGILSLDKMLEAEYLQDFHFKTLSCYVLKANLIPAQYTRIPSVIQVKVDSVWQNYNVVENNFVKPPLEAETQLTKISFTLKDENGHPITVNEDNIAVTIFQDGRFYINDRQLSYDKENSTITGELDKGEYQLQIGVRESGEMTKVKLVSLDLESQTDISQVLLFEDFKRNWKSANNNYIEFLETHTDTISNWVVLLGDYNLEPPQRLATKTRANLTNQQFIWLGEKTAVEYVSNYKPTPDYKVFLDENPELKNRLITFYYQKEKNLWKMFEGNWDVLVK